MEITLPLDADHIAKIEMIAAATQLSVGEIALWVLKQCEYFATPNDYADFERKLRQLELDAMLLLHDTREHNRRFDEVVKIVREE